MDPLCPNLLLAAMFHHSSGNASWGTPFVDLGCASYARLADSEAPAVSCFSFSLGSGHTGIIDLLGHSSYLSSQHFIFCTISTAPDHFLRVKFLSVIQN